MFQKKFLSFIIKLLLTKVIYSVIVKSLNNGGILMDKMQSTARKLDIFFHIFQVALNIAAVAAAVGIAIVAAFFIFDLKPEQVATGYNVLDFGAFELELAAKYVPDESRILLMKAADMAMGLVCAVISWFGVKCIRSILSPMREGLPFSGLVAPGLKKLAVLSLVLGIIVNITKAINIFLTMKCYGLPDLLISDAVTKVTVNFELDLSFIAVAAVLLLLSYIFRYGEELQQLSDETL